jgi:Na+/proline symporter/nitrogen-specific signal transduction histidine kinase
MLSANIVLFTALAYVALLFLVAFVSDTRARKGWLGLVRSPVVYTLSISVYCTSWTFYGAVGSAARSGLEFATIYLGPTLVFVGWWFLLRKLVRIGRIHRTSSIGDLISSRYGKSTSLAVLVTLIAVVGTTPYIALQLKAVTASFQVIADATNTSLLGMPTRELDVRTGFWIAAGMAVFTILFGTRNINANEHHHGVVAAIALEALVKLFALLAVGLYVVFSIGGGVAEVFRLPTAAAVLQGPETFGTRWVALTFLSAAAIVCLPRQFQITVVENADEGHLRTAGWLFPLYLFLISLFTLPIAIVGLATLPAGSNPDMFVLTLPMLHDQSALALLVFIGGFSSATSMVIVASIALSIMVSNHIVMPIVLRLPRRSVGVSGDVKKLLLVSRRISIGVILLLGFAYFVASARSDALAAMGLIAFAGVAQFLPSLIGGLYWHQASKSGAFSGLLAGVLVWGYTLLLPSFEGGPVSASLINDGPWGITALRPQALFGADGVDPLVHSLFWSLGLNLALFVLVSLFRDLKPLERLQATLFIDVFRNPADNESRFIRRSAAIDDLYILAQRILGTDQAQRLFQDFARRQGSRDDLPQPDTEFIAHLERQLAGGIGAASARVMVSQVITGETISLDELMRLVDETQQVIEYSQQLEHKSQQLQITAGQLREANERLKTLDAQKDDFLSQVSHEVRTPMASIRSFSEILLSNQDLSTDQSMRFLDIIHTETLRLTRLLDEILDLSHLERGELTWTLEPVDASAILRRAVETCQGMADGAEVDVEVDCRADDVEVFAHRDRLSQVFINLISNAIKHNTDDAPRLRIVSSVLDGRFIVDVQDNGPGIAPADRERIFTKFSRAWTTARPTATGAGLGLAITRAILRRMNGTLDLLPSMGAGACFRVALPVRRAAADVSK